MDGVWLVIATTVTGGTAANPTPIPVGQIVVIQNGVAVAVGTQTQARSLARGDIETTLGFTLDWYSNAAGGSLGDFGYGWDRLRVAGGGGAFWDYGQYGFRVAPVDNDLLVGYEAEIRQDFLGEPRTDWTASHLLTRQ